MRRGQVWVETVVYTLIGLTLIGIVLAIITPKVNEFRDRSVLEQTISSMQTIDSEITEVVRGGIGNARRVDFRMKKGDIYFDKQRDRIYYILEDSRVLFSEPEVEVEIGRIKVFTEEGTKRHKVTLALDYSLDLDFEGDNVIKFTPSSIPYQFRFEKTPTVNDREGVFFREISS